MTPSSPSQPGCSALAGAQTAQSSEPPSGLKGSLPESISATDTAAPTPMTHDTAPPHPAPKSTHSAADEPEDSGCEFVFKPAYFFFYGSLMDPDVLARVARLHPEERPPELRDASLAGWKLMLWGNTYPTIVPVDTTGPVVCQHGPNGYRTRADVLEDAVAASSSSPVSGCTGNQVNKEEQEVQGKIWLATDMVQCLRLQTYETSAYIATDVVVRLKDGPETVIKAVTFCWSGDADDSFLSEGTWSLEHFQQHVKPKLFGTSLS